MTRRRKVKSKMENLTVENIKDFIIATWNDCTGYLFREVGFEIIEERVGEEECDRIYDEIYAITNA